MGEHTGNMILTPPSPMEGFDPDAVLSKLTTAEKIDLLSGILATSCTLFDSRAHVPRYRFLAHEIYPEARRSIYQVLRWP